MRPLRLLVTTALTASLTGAAWPALGQPVADAAGTPPLVTAGPQDAASGFTGDVAAAFRDPAGEEGA